MDTKCMVMRRWETLRYAEVMAAAVLTGGCAQILGIERLSSRFAVHGTATGVLGPVALELRLGDDDELLTVEQDGTFKFETRLEDGTSYTVELANPGLPCRLRNQTGIIAGAEPVIELTCTGASLASVVVSGIEPPTIKLVPGTTTYEIELPLLQQSVTLTAAVAMAGDTLTIGDTRVASAEPSGEIMLSLGDNPVDIVVENDLGWRRTYRLILRRAAGIAQFVYGKASNTGAGDNFGYSVALWGDTLVVGAHLEDSATQGVGGNQDDDSTPESGAVYVFRRTGTAWQQEAYLKASNPGAGSIFGVSVALSGDALAVGAISEDSAAPDSGAVYVFHRTGTTWLQEALLKAANPGIGDYFGYGLALSGDTLAIGAHGEDSAGRGVGGNQDENSVESGAVYVFRRTGTAWQQDAFLKASNSDAGDHFGISVALSGDTLAVGAFTEDSAASGVGGNQDDNGATDSGAVYVFRRTDTGWQQEAYIKASNTGVEEDFGRSVALAGDTLAVGAHDEDSAANGINGDQADDSASNSGAVYVFRRAGTAWQQEAYIKASNSGAGDFFGWSVALSGDTLAIGAHSEDSTTTSLGGHQDDDSATDSGAVYVFRRFGTTWQQDAFLKASNSDAGDLFGFSMALSGDALAVGAYLEDSPAWGVGGNQDDNGATDSGAVYIFH
jgi:hypothetical protein